MGDRVAKEADIKPQEPITSETIREALQDLPLSKGLDIRDPPHTVNYVLFRLPPCHEVDW